MPVWAWDPAALDGVDRSPAVELGLIRVALGEGDERSIEGDAAARVGRRWHVEVPSLAVLVGRSLERATGAPTAAAGSTVAARAASLPSAPLPALP
jgi:hypothetical protein